jgi:predicted GIY-YIG superfamily endonuclease
MTIELPQPQYAYVRLGCDTAAGDKYVIKVGRTNNMQQRILDHSKEYPNFKPCTYENGKRIMYCKPILVNTRRTMNHVESVLRNHCINCGLVVHDINHNGNYGEKDWYSSPNDDSATVRTYESVRDELSNVYNYYLGVSREIRRRIKVLNSECLN